MFESAKTTIAKLKLHVEIIKIEYYHWVDSIKELEADEKLLTIGLQRLTDPSDIERKRKWVRQAGVLLREAEGEAQRVKREMDKTVRLIRQLEWEQLQMTAPKEDERKVGASSK